jgi:hypothetical protein
MLCSYYRTNLTRERRCYLVEVVCFLISALVSYYYGARNHTRIPTRYFPVNALNSSEMHMPLITFHYHFLKIIMWQGKSRSRILRLLPHVQSSC